MTKIKISERDFYTAYYNLNKTDHLNIDERILINFRLLTQGVKKYYLII